MGTLGLVVAEPARPALPLLLSSSHVLNLRPDGRVYPLFQPAGRDGRERRPVAHSYRYTRLDPAGRNSSEAGLAMPVDPLQVDAVHPLVGRITGVRHATVGMRLLKLGRTTGAVSGVVTATRWEGPVRIEGHRYRLVGQVVVRGDGGPTSMLGDSGSVWVSPEGYAVALSIAGDDDGRVSIATPVARVLDRLGVGLWRQP